MRRWGRAWAFLERVDAPDYDWPYENYMTRWRLISTPWFGLYVHRIDKPDPRPTLHDHPWPFVTLVLKGGYTEDFGVRLRRDGDKPGPIVKRVCRSWRRWSVHRMRKTDAHTITSVTAPTWTLLVAGRRRQEPSWGYWDHTGFTPFDQHPHAAEFAAAKAARRGNRPVNDNVVERSGFTITNRDADPFIWCDGCNAGVPIAEGMTPTSLAAEHVCSDRPNTPWDAATFPDEHTPFPEYAERRWPANAGVKCSCGRQARWVYLGPGGRAVPYCL